MKKSEAVFLTGAERAALVAGVAGTIGLLSTDVANAAIVVNPAATGSAMVTSWGQNASNKTIGVDLDGPVGATVTDLFIFYSGGGNFVVSMNSAFGTLAGFTVGFMPYAQFFNSTGLIAGPFLSSFSSAMLGSAWTGNIGYIGFRVAATGDYGWLQVDLSVPGQLTVLGWQPQNAANGVDHSHLPGGTATPEPATSGLALLALGAAGVLRHKRRQRNS